MRIHNSLGGISSASTTGDAIGSGQKFTGDGLIGGIYQEGSFLEAHPSTSVMATLSEDFGSAVISNSKGEEPKIAISSSVLISGQPKLTQGGVFVLLPSTLVSPDASPIIFGSKAMGVPPGVSIAHQTMSTENPNFSPSVLANNVGVDGVTDSIVEGNTSGEPVVKSNVVSDMSIFTLNGQATVASIPDSLDTGLVTDGMTIVLPVIILTTGPSTLTVKAQTMTTNITATSMTESTAIASANLTMNHSLATYNVSSEVPGITPDTTTLPTSNKIQASKGSRISSLTGTAMLGFLTTFYLAYT